MQTIPFDSMQGSGKQPSPRTVSYALMSHHNKPQPPHATSRSRASSASSASSAFPAASYMSIVGADSNMFDAAPIGQLITPWPSSSVDRLIRGHAFVEQKESVAPHSTALTQASSDVSSYLRPLLPLPPVFASALSSSSSSDSFGAGVPPHSSHALSRFSSSSTSISSSPLLAGAPYDPTGAASGSAAPTLNLQLQLQPYPPTSQHHHRHNNNTNKQHSQSHSHAKRPLFRRPVTTGTREWSKPTQPHLRLPMLRSIMSMPTGATTPSSPSASATPNSLAALTPTELAIYTHSPAYEHSLHLETGEHAIAYFAKFGSNTPVKFVYCNRKPPSTKAGADSYRPYDLVVVDRKNVQPEYFTISPSGLVHISPNEPSESIPLSEWVYQSSMFDILRSIRFFRCYLVAKLFRFWRSNVRYRIYCKQRRQLTNKLFLARESFCAPLLETNRIMYDIAHVPLCDVQQKQVYLAEQFAKDQAEARTSAAKKFETHIEKVEEIVESVCKGVKDRARQFDHRIANDDLSNSRFAQHLLGGSGKIKSMVSIKQERADRLKQLQHANLEADMLGDFIRLVDYIEVEHLVARSISSTTSFLHTLLTSNKALFQTTVSFSSRSATGSFSPTSADIHNIVGAMNEGCISTVDTVERILYHPKFKPFVNPSVLESTSGDMSSSASSSSAAAPKIEIDIAKIIHADRTYNLTKQAIDEKVDSDFLAIGRTISFLDKHRPVFEYGEQWSLDQYRHSEHTVDTLAADLRQQSEWALGVSRIRDYYDAGLVQAETKVLKAQLMPVTEHAISGIKVVMLGLFHAQCVEVQSEFMQKMKTLDEEPVTLPQYAAHIQLFHRVRDEGLRLRARAKQIEQMHQLMLDYDMQSMIPPADEVAYDDMLSAVHAFEKAMNQTDNKIEDKMPAMRQTVYKNIQRLNHELEQQIQLMSLEDHGQFMDDKTAPKEVLKNLDTAKLNLNDLQAQATTLQNYQVLFDTEPYPFARLPVALAAYEKKRALWSLYVEWLDKSKKWNNANLVSLDARKVERDVDEAYAAIVQFHGESKEGSVTGKLKTLIAEFKQSMPLIVSICDKAKLMRNEQWRALFAAVNQSYYPNQTIKLKQLKQMNMVNERTVALMEKALASEGGAEGVGSGAVPSTSSSSSSSSSTAVGATASSSSLSSLSSSSLSSSK